MLLNRLSNFSFLPSTSSSASMAADAAQSAVGSGMGAVDNAAAPASEGVLLHLNSASKVTSTGTYTKDGLFSDFSDLPRTTPLTPAEEFVAAAVINLRNYDQAKANAATDVASKSAGGLDAAQRGRFDSIKQAVSKLYASA